jgi:two-component system response regulator RegA
MRLLVVEDDVPLREAICAAARNWAFLLPEVAGVREGRFHAIAQAGGLQEGVAQLEKPVDMVILDVKLGEESGLELVEHMRRSGRVPAILSVSGQATAAEAFHLAARGVRGYLAKPFDMHELRAAIAAIFAVPPDLSSGAMAQVGYRHIHVVQDEVKRAMLKRALESESGNISRAARRLGVTRAAVQQMLDRYGFPRASDRGEGRED